MSYTQAIISGIVQGVTEFLPISSSGHLVILHNYFGFREPQLFFDIFLHIGTLFAVVVYFWRDIIKVLTGKKPFLLYIILGTVPTVFIGFFFKDILESCFVSIKIVGVMLLFTAAFLFAADWVSRRKAGVSQSGRLNWAKAFIIGIVQGIAIMPGISRSGSTISSAMLMKVDKADAIRFSFLLSIPAIMGAMVLKLIRAQGIVEITLPMVSGAFFAFLFGLGAIYLLIRAVIKSNLKFFGFYCLVIGAAVIIL